MGQVSTIGLDLAKSIFQVHGADASGAVVFRKRLRRSQVRPFLAAQPPCTVAMEACGSAPYWAREIRMLGHAGRLIPPGYVKPFVKRQKNNATDAEAISPPVRPGALLISATALCCWSPLPPAAGGAPKRPRSAWPI